MRLWLGYRRRCFNSRTPGGVRPPEPSSRGRPSRFQFTHPGRGATRHSVRRFAKYSRFNSRTPGGVRHGTHCQIVTAPLFQFTHPGRGATTTTWRSLPSVAEFQFTHPGRGATQDAAQTAYKHHVSIHAPREGCDASRVTPASTPDWFQFTHPGRGATHLVTMFIIPVTFQFTHPGRGATSPSQTPVSPSMFQFTHPGRGATTPILTLRHQRPVSIHAPREGCDWLSPTPR